MPYTGNPSTNPIDELRLTVGDTWDDFEMLSDADYQYFLDKTGSFTRAVMDAARSILFKLTRFTRERTGDIDVYGAEWFKNYRDALLLMVNNPNVSLVVAMPYAGGIDSLEMAMNRCDYRNVRLGIAGARTLYDSCCDNSRATTRREGVDNGFYL